MKPNDHIELAKRLVQRIESAIFKSTRYDRQSGQNVPENVQGTDRDELKRIFSFLVARKDLAQLRRLVQLLPSSDFAGRSNKTKGYFTNIRAALEDPQINFFNMALGDGLQLLGWACRLLPAKSEESSARTSPKRRSQEQVRFGGKKANAYGYSAEGQISPEQPDELRKAESPKVSAAPAPSSTVERPIAKQSTTPTPPTTMIPKGKTTPPQPLKPVGKPAVKQGDKLEAEVIANEGGRVTIRLIGEINQEVTFDQPYYPEPKGKRVKVKVISVTPEGKVKKVVPA